MRRSIPGWSALAVTIDPGRTTVWNVSKRRRLGTLGVRAPLSLAVLEVGKGIVVTRDAPARGHGVVLEARSPRDEILWSRPDLASEEVEPIPSSGGGFLLAWAGGRCLVLSPTTGESLYSLGSSVNGAWSGGDARVLVQKRSRFELHDLEARSVLWECPGHPTVAGGLAPRLVAWSLGASVVARSAVNGGPRWQWTWGGKGTVETIGWSEEDGCWAVVVIAGFDVPAERCCVLLSKSGKQLEVAELGRSYGVGMFGDGNRLLVCDGRVLTTRGALVWQIPTA